MNEVVFKKRFNVKKDLFSDNEQGLWLDPSDMTAGKAGWRRNLLTYSEGTAAQFSPTSQVTTASTSISGFSNSIQFGDNSVQRYAYSQAATISGLSYTLSVYVQMDDDSIPSVGTSTGSGDFNVVFSNSVVSTPLATVSLVSGSLYRISVVKTGDGLSGRNFGILKNTGQSSKTFRVTGYQLELGSLSEYQKITDFATEFKAAFPTHALYQDSNGVTPCTAAGDPVGLIIDQSRGGLGALGSEVVPDPTLTSTTGWVLDASWTASGGNLVADNSAQAAQTFASSPEILTQGKQYLVVIEITAITGAGGIRLDCRPTAGGTGATNHATITTTGTHRTIVNNTGANTRLALRLASNTQVTTATVASISVREVPGNHAYQTTSGARPTLARIPSSGRRNVLTRTEEFDNAAWGVGAVSVTANNAISPDGTTTADTVTESATTDYHRLSNSNISRTSGITYTLSVYAKLGTGTRFLIINSASAINAMAAFNLSTGAVHSTTSGSAAIQSVGGGWYRCSVTGTATITGTSTIYFQLDDNGTDGTYAGDGTSSLLLWGAQLETGSTATNYQKVVATTDVTESGVGDLWHLVFDGSDDSLVTNSISFDTWTQETRRNLLVDTESFGSSNWNTTGTTVTANAIAGPFTGQSADLISGNGTSTSTFRSQAVTALGSSVHTASVYLKKNNHDFAALMLTDWTGAATIVAYFNLNNGTTPTAGAAITSVGDGWYRCSVGITPLIGDLLGSFRVWITPSTSAFTWSAAADNNNLGFYATGVQFEAGTLTDYQRVGTDEMTVIAGVRKFVDELDILAELSADSSANNGAFYLSTGGSGRYSFVTKGTASANATSSVNSSTPPITNVIAGVGDISSDIAILRQNGVQVASVSTDQGSGNYGNYALYIGRRGSVSFPFTGHLYQLIIRGKTTPTGKLLEAEKFVSKKTGVNL